MWSRCVAGVRALWGSWIRDWVLLVALGMALAMWLVIALAEPRNAPTSDEYWHVTRGVAALRAPDTRLNRPHPPFAQALAMLPVSLTTRPDFENMRGWSTASMVRVSSAFTKTDYAQGRSYLRAGRLMNGALAAGLCVFLVLWLRRRFGTTTAIAGGLLYATCPIVLAHAGLVTNDFGLGAATLLAFAGLLSYLDHGGWWRLLRAGCAVALLPIVKVSGLLVVALLALVPLAWFVRREGAYSGKGFARAAVSLLVDYAIVALLVLLAINAVYRFNHTFLTLEELAAVAYPKSYPVDGTRAEYTILKYWPSTWRVPLPLTYLNCTEFVNRKNESGHSSFWFGHRSRGGSELYFPFMLLGKTQALLLPLIFVGFVLNARRMLSGAGKWLALVAFGFLAAAMTSTINIGVRHVFPTLMCLVVLGARGADVVLGFVNRRMRRGAQVLAAAGAVSVCAGVAWSFPAYVGDFNVLIGPELGRQANPIAEDWGQSAGDLPRELARRGLTSVAYVPRHSSGMADLMHSGLQVRKLGCSGRARGADAVAIHLTKWQRSRRCYRRLRKREPDFVVHHDILVFILADPKTKAKAADEAEPAAQPDVPANAPPENEGEPGAGGRD